MDNYEDGHLEADYEDRNGYPEDIYDPNDDGYNPEPDDDDYIEDDDSYDDTDDVEWGDYWLERQELEDFENIPYESDNDLGDEW